MTMPEVKPHPKYHASETLKHVMALMLIAAALLLGLGCYMGLRTKEDCGSPWTPTEGSMSQTCQQDWGSRGDIGAVLVGLAGVTALGSLVMWNQERIAWQASSAKVPAPRED